MHVDTALMPCVRGVCSWSLLMWLDQVQCYWQLHCISRGSMGQPGRLTDTSRVQAGMNACESIQTWQPSTFASHPMDSLSAKCSQVEFAIRVKPRWDFVASFMLSVLASVLSLCSFHKQTSWSSFRSGTAGTKVQPGSSTTQRAQIKKILLAPEITRGTHHQVS